MQPTISETISPLNLEERVALLWIREHQPCIPPPEKCSARTRVRLLQRGLIRFDPKRQRFDPVAYALTEAGTAALG